jgi:hypothetical protein
MLNLDKYLGKGRQAGEEDLDLDAAPGQLSFSMVSKADVQHPPDPNSTPQPCLSLKLWVSLLSDVRKHCWLLEIQMRIPQ